MNRRGESCIRPLFRAITRIAPTISLLISSHSLAATFSRTQILMGNVPVTITIKAPSSQKMAAFRGMENAYKTAKRIERKVSEFQPVSETSCLNRNAGKKKCRIGNDLLILLTISRSLSVLTQGAYDITFASQNKSASFRDVFVDERAKKAFLKKPNMRIGVSSIAKGYILDQMAVILMLEGFHHFIVNGGGDLLAEGKWKIKIRGSRNSFHLKDQTAMSSGLLERGHHIIDPQTHTAVDRDYLSVTIISPSGMIGGALGTGAFVMGPDKTKKILKQIPGTKAIFLYKNKILRVPLTLRNEEAVEREAKSGR